MVTLVISTLLVVSVNASADIHNPVLKTTYCTEHNNKTDLQRLCIGTLDDKRVLMLEEGRDRELFPMFDITRVESPVWTTPIAGQRGSEETFKAVIGDQVYEFNIQIIPAQLSGRIRGIFVTELGIEEKLYQMPTRRERR